MMRNGDSIPASNIGKYSPAIAKRNVRNLQRTKSSPVFFPSASSSSGPTHGADLPPLIGAPEDPSSSRYSKLDKQNVPAESPVLTRRGRHIKPILMRQGSEPQLHQRLNDIKLNPSPPGHESPRSNGSSICDSPRLRRTRKSRSVECSPATLRRTFPGASISPTTPMSTAPMSPLRSGEALFQSPSSYSPGQTSAPNSPMVSNRSVKLRRGRTNSNSSDVHPGENYNRHSLPGNFTDFPPRNTSFEHPQHNNAIINPADPCSRTVDDETGEPIVDVATRIRHSSGGPGDESSTHSVTNQSCDMLYDIAETRDETTQDEETEKCSNKSEPPQSSNDDSEEDSLPEYQKSPLSTNNRVTKWLLGLAGKESESISDDPSKTENLLPDIHS